MKNAILITMTFVLLLSGCKTKEVLINKSSVTAHKKQVDLLNIKIAMLSSRITVLKDSISEFRSVIKTKETTTTKASILQTEIEISQASTLFNSRQENNSPNLIISDSNCL